MSVPDRVPDPVKPPTVAPPKPADALRAVVPASLRVDAEAFAFAAFDSGHYPNPVGHSFDGCSTCRAAKAAVDLVEYLDAGPDRDTQGAVHVSKVVRRHLISNGDWNINDWKDVADALSAFVLRNAGEDPHAR